MVRNDLLIDAPMLGGAAVPAQLAQWRRAQARTDELFALLPDETFGARPIAERHRLIFYLGHLEAFDWNLLGRDTLALGVHDEELDPLFAFGIDPLDGDLPRDAVSDWPSLPATLAYVRTVRARLGRALEHALAAPRGELAWRLAAAIEHRWMHVETLTSMLHELPRSKRRNPLVDRDVAAPPLEPRSVIVPSGRVLLGSERGLASTRGVSGFGWDNEFDAHEVDVPELEIDAFPVTNAQFARFVDDGGYDARELWAEDDWAWKEARGIRHPHFWIERTESYARWWHRGFVMERPLPADWPVHVTYAEASAYATWRGARLPTEAEWQRVAWTKPWEHARVSALRAARGDGSSQPLAALAEGVHEGNFGLRRFDPTPVQAHAPNALGIHDLVGNGWEWTSSTFAPFPNFQAQSFYPGYSAPFFDGRRFVLKGAAARTASELVRPSFRNWFQPRFPYVQAKFRCVTS